MTSVAPERTPVIFEEASAHFQATRLERGRPSLDDMEVESVGLSSIGLADIRMYGPVIARSSSPSLRGAEHERPGGEGVEAGVTGGLCPTRGDATREQLDLTMAELSECRSQWSNKKQAKEHPDAACECSEEKSTAMQTRLDASLMELAVSKAEVAAGCASLIDSRKELLQAQEELTRIRGVPRCL